MRIGIDARTILNPSKGDAIGIGHYTYQLIRHLLEIDQENEYVLFFDYRVREKDVKKFDRPNVKIKFYPFSDYKKFLPGAYNELLGTATLVKGDLDVIHTTSPMSRIPVSYRGKTIVTINDMAAYKTPESFPKLAVAKNKAVLNMMVDKADKIIAVSNSIKNDLHSLLQCPGEKIEVIYSGFDRRFFDESNISREKVLEKFAIKNGKYILFLGTLEPAKNVVRLFEAFKIFRKKCMENGDSCENKLVMAGKNGWLANYYKQIVKDMCLTNQVIFTGYVIGDEIVSLFAQADFFVMPSLYEGFGTTVLEAFATGTPAIVSGVSSIPEIAGDAAQFVNPLDVEDIASAMLKLAKDESLKQSLREKGKQQVTKFDWTKCARETLEVYKTFENK